MAGIGHLKRCIGQRVIFGFEGTRVPPEILRLDEEWGLGGYILDRQNFEDFDPSCMEGAENADVGPVPSSVAKVLVERYSMTSVCCNDGEKLESMFLDEREQMTRAKKFKVSALSKTEEWSAQAQTGRKQRRSNK